ncbi:MAG: endo-1,4-beta-xylanase [Ruminococcus sp.]|nr:endo-1,4-beta-xylanase [Ruminococcus sp.]
MKKQRLLSAVTALSVCAGMAAVFPGISAETYAAEVVSNTFEVNYDGWHGSDTDVELTAAEGIGLDGTRGMAVSGRKTSDDGAQSSKGFYLSGGVKYNYSVSVYSKTAEKFHVTLTYLDEDTDEATTVELVSREVGAGEWTTLSAEYKAPANTYEYRIDITTDSTNDFVFDEVSVTTEKYKGVKAAPAGKGLKDEFANYFRVGNILNGNTVKNSTITADYIKDFNSIECENETKPDATLVQSGSTNTNIKVSLNSCAAIADFCVNNGIGFRGHTMVWHSQTPSWFFKDNFQDTGNWVDKSTMNQRMESYIKNMFDAFETQYPDLDLFAYDICNECVSDDSNRTANYGGAREAGDSKVSGQGGKSAWVQVYGDNSFVEQAFTYARKYAPSTCKLFYNDYNEYWDHKRDCIYEMCKSLYEKGVLDGVGMQSHVPANATGFAGTDSYIVAMKKYLSIGCEVQITELDISIQNNGTTYSYTDQADKYTAIAQAAMDWNDDPQGTGRVTLYQVWGPNDANSWLSAGSNGLLRDSSNQPKEAYTRLYSMLPDSEWGTGIPYTGPGSTGFDPNKTVEPNEYGWYFHSTFEGTTDSWSSRGGTSVQTSGRTAYVGDESLLVSDRTASWNGASYALSSRIFKPGEEYSFSANVSYFDGEDTTQFKFTLQYTGSDGEAHYDEIASATGAKGEWVQLANTNYKIPEDASDMMIYIETSDDSTENFYIDEVIGAVGGTGIIGAGQPEIIPFVLGDINADGRVDAFDMAPARKGIAGGFSDSRAQKAADVDQSGKYEVNDLVLLCEFVLGKIRTFPVAEKTVDTEAMEQLFSTVNIAESYKKDGENNPLYTQRFGADPGFMVYKDRLYVYTTNDAFEYDGSNNLKENSYDVGTINCCSSADLVNWTDHGAIPVAGRNGRTTNGAASWASCSWAPDACWKTINGKDKFFLYFANSGGGIGVLTADSPEGPWTDPLGHALVTGQTPNCSDVVWMFDPAVLVDDDGTGYLYFGGGVPDGKQADPGTGRCVKLGDDMISLAGTPVKMNTPYLFEDSSILKIGDQYVYSYCTNWNTTGNNIGIANAQIAYMTSSDPLGPFTFQGVMFKNTAESGLDKGGNNHHSLVYFKDNYYLLYHTRVVENRMGINQNYRSPSISAATVSGNKITVDGSHTGVAQLQTLSPYTKVQAETMSNQSKDVTVTGLGDTVVSGTKGSWIKASGVSFSSGADTLTVSASSNSGAVIKVCTKSATGTAIAYAEIPAGGTLSSVTVPVVSSVSGTNDLYFVFSGDLSFDSWSFS